MKQLIVALALVAGSASAEEPPHASIGPKDKVVSGTEKLDRAMAPVLEQARKSWPAAKKRFLAGLPEGQIFYVSVELREGREKEQCFMRVYRILDGKIQGTLANDPVALKKMRNGDKITVRESDVYDWMISKPDGTEEGNVIGKFLETWQG